MKEGKNSGKIRNPIRMAAAPAATHLFCSEMWTNSFLSKHTVKCNICSLAFSLKINSNFVFCCVVFSVWSTVSTTSTQFPCITAICPKIFQFQFECDAFRWMRRLGFPNAPHANRVECRPYEMPKHFKWKLSWNSSNKTVCHNAENANGMSQIHAFNTSIEWNSCSAGASKHSGNGRDVELVSCSKHSVVPADWVESHFRLVSLLCFQCVTVACCEGILTQTKSKEAQHGRQERQHTKRIGRGEGYRTIHDWRSIQFVPSTQNDWLCSSSLGHFLISTHTVDVWNWRERARIEATKRVIVLARGIPNKQYMELSILRYDKIEPKSEFETK